MLSHFHPLDSSVTFILAGLAIALPEFVSAGEKPASDKSGYHLFNPTPTALLRDLTTDRPDTTESPITVDAGRFQVEMSFFDFTRTTSRDRVRTDQTVVAPINIKVGLLKDVDLQFVLDPSVISRTKSPGQPTETVRGLGDLTLRLKINLWGNDGPEPGFGPTSFGLMPFVKLPTARRTLGNGRVEGGLILPFGVSLPAGFELGLMAEFDIVRNDSNTRYGLDFVHTATLGRKVVGELRAYIEYVGIAPHRTEGTYQAYFSTGLTHPIGKNTQLDLGVRVGLNRGADDFNVFSGLSFRF